MSTYDDLRAKVEQLGGSAGPDGVGSINLHGGTEIKMKYDVPGPGTRVISVVPYLVGSDQTPSSSPPSVDHQRLLAWQYKPDPGSNADPAWRCFMVGRIVTILPGPFPRPAPADLPTLDPDRQNCVESY
jgi:hypothetical protein